MRPRTGVVLFALLVGCAGPIGSSDGDGLGDTPGLGPDGLGDLGGASTDGPTSATDDLSRFDDGGVGADAAVPYPGLPASCQPLFNHGADGCVDTWAVPIASWELMAIVQSAADSLDPANATLFDPDGSVPAAKQPAYTGAIIAILDAQGLCAAWRAPELYVHAATHDYSETFMLFNNHSEPHLSGHYQCAPAASIPGAPLPVPPPAQGCVPTFLPPGTIQTTACELQGAQGSATMYYDDAVAAVLDVIASEQAKGSASLIFDFAHTNLVFQSGWEDKGFRVIDVVFFLDAVAQRLTPLGYCFEHNDYDTIILKRDLSRSEDFDLVQAYACGGGGQPACTPTRPSGNYVRYPGKGTFCSLAEF